MDFDDLRNGFEEFQKGREWCDDLHGRFPDDLPEGSKGWLYCGGRPWIQDTTTWSEDAAGYGEGRWYLHVGNMERQSDDLTELEEPLYDYARSEDLLG
jgi:hypothetical protein